MTPVSLPSGRPGTPIILGARAGATDIAVTPDGTTAYIVALQNIARMPGVVVPVNTRTGTAGRVIHVATSR